MSKIIVERNPRQTKDQFIGRKKKPAVIEIEDHPHSDLGPSASERWLECLGSVLATRGMPDISSDYAIQGTAAHTVSEWCRQQNVRASKFLGTMVGVKTADRGIVLVECDQEMVDGVQAFVDFVNDLPGDAHFETRVHYEAWVPGGFGTSDDARIQDGVCTITDLKFGEGIQVFAKDNTQLMLYALGFFHDFGHLYDIKEFELIIFQPRLDHIDRWHISLADLLIWARDVAMPRAHMALQPDAAFKAGDWCRFCKIKERCAARAESAMRTVAEEFDDLDEAAEKAQELEGEGVAEGAASLLSNEQIAKLLPAIAGARAYFTAIEKLAMSEVQQGRAIGDYKLVEGRSNRAWDAPEEKVVKALKGARVRTDDIYTKKLISPAQAEKLVGKTHKIISELVKKPKGSPVLVPGSDPRPAMTVNAEDEFDDLDADS
jgi:hypothetical protein